MGVATLSLLLSTSPVRFCHKVSFLTIGGEMFFCNGSGAGPSAGIDTGNHAGPKIFLLN